MKKIMISSDLLVLPWQHSTIGISSTFAEPVMFCLYIISKNKMLQTFMFSEMLRPKMGLIDPMMLVT